MEIENLKNQSGNLWKSIIKVIECSTRKIVGDSFNKETVSLIVEKIRKSFPDEQKLNLRVSQDMFTLFASLENKDVVISKDGTMDNRSVVVELGEGVADFSIHTQLKKVIEWIEEEENVR